MCKRGPTGARLRTSLGAAWAFVVERCGTVRPVKDRFIPIEDAAPGITIVPLLPNYTVLEAVMLIKCLDEHGEEQWVSRWSDGINIAEVVGATKLMHELALHNALSAYEDDP